MANKIGSSLLTGCRSFYCARAMTGKLQEEGGPSVLCRAPKSPKIWALQRTSKGASGAVLVSRRRGDVLDRLGGYF